MCELVTKVQLSRDGTRALVASYDASLRSHVVAIDVVRNLERRVTVGAGGEGSLCGHPMEHEWPWFQFLVSTHPKWDAQFSPNGRWVAYTSFESGRFETFVSPFRETTGDPISGAPPLSRWQVSSGGGSAPRWRADGNEIFYWSAESKKLMAVAVGADGARFDAGRPEPLFNARPLQEAYPITFYDVSADGQRFLVNGVEAKSGTPSRLDRELAAPSTKLSPRSSRQFPTIDWYSIVAKWARIAKLPPVNCVQ